MTNEEGVCQVGQSENSQFPLTLRRLQQNAPVPKPPLLFQTRQLKRLDVINANQVFLFIAKNIQKQNNVIIYS